MTVPKVVMQLDTKTCTAEEKKCWFGVGNESNVLCLIVCLTCVCL
jgi:hypothetical protein